MTSLFDDRCSTALDATEPYRPEHVPPCPHSRRATEQAAVLAGSVQPFGHVDEFSGDEDENFDSNGQA